VPAENESNEIKSAGGEVGSGGEREGTFVPNEGGSKEEDEEEEQQEGEQEPAILRESRARSSAAEEEEEEVEEEEEEEVEVEVEVEVEEVEEGVEQQQQQQQQQACTGGSNEGSNERGSNEEGSNEGVSGVEEQEAEVEKDEAAFIAVVAEDTMEERAEDRAGGRAEDTALSTAEVMPARQREEAVDNTVDAGDDAPVSLLAGAGGGEDMGIFAMLNGLTDKVVEGVQKRLENDDGEDEELRLEMEGYANTDAGRECTIRLSPGFATNAAIVSSAKRSSTDRLKKQCQQFAVLRMHMLCTQVRIHWMRLWMARWCTTTTNIRKDAALKELDQQLQLAQAALETLELVKRRRGELKSGGAPEEAAGLPPLPAPPLPALPPPVPQETLGQGAPKQDAGQQDPMGEGGSTMDEATSSAKPRLRPGATCLTSPTHVFGELIPPTARQ
jgi:hypothetical protein